MTIFDFDLAFQKIMKGRTNMIKVGIIGGSGLYNPDILKNPKDINIDTEYGSPSSHLKTGEMHDVEVAIISRHGRDHKIPPTHVNYPANIKALKDYGCTHILATTACGSLREKICRGDFIILDQFIDFTRLRRVSFYDSFPGGGENAKHTAMPYPFNEELRQIMIESAKELDIKHHPKGTVITIEGSRFSTVAESKMFRAWGADIINMSIAPEAILANEAGIPYGAVAMSTDYDCWREDEEPVTWKEILEVFSKNVDRVTRLLLLTVQKMTERL